MAQWVGEGKAMVPCPGLGMETTRSPVTLTVRPMLVPAVAPHVLLTQTHSFCEAGALGTPSSSPAEVYGKAPGSGLLPHTDFQGRIAVFKGIQLRCQQKSIGIE